MRRLLTGEKVQLGSFSEDEQKLMVDWHSDEDFMRHIDSRPAMPLRSDQVKAWFEEDQKRDNSFLFVIRRLEDRVPVGFIALEGIQWNHRNGWMGIGIASEHQGKGYGEEAIRLLLQFAFRELNLHRVQLTVFGYNERGIKLYEKLGFRFEGKHRDFLLRDGQYHDMLIYGILENEWMGGQS